MINAPNPREEALAELRYLPDHIQSHAGAIAIDATHEDLHPRYAEEGIYADTELISDFSQVVTDPSYDSALLDQRAVEAAHAGNQQLSDILLTSASALRTGYDALVSMEVTFGASDAETDEQRQERELVERNMVYDDACNEIVHQAIVTKKEGDTDRATKLLESVVMLRYMREGPDDVGNDNRLPIRNAISAGLAPELLTAVRQTNKIYAKGGTLRINKVSHSFSWPLELYTGEALDSEFGATGREARMPFYEVDGETIKDFMAVIAAKGTWLTPEKAFDPETGIPGLKTLGEQYDPNSVRGKGSIKYLRDVMEACPDPKIFLKVEDPMATIEIADRMEIDPELYLKRFVREVSYGEDGRVLTRYEPMDDEMVQKYVQMHDRFPAQFQKIITEGPEYNGCILDKDGDQLYHPEFLIYGLQVLEQAGVNFPELAPFIAGYVIAEAPAETCVALFEAGKEIGIESPRLLAELRKYEEIPNNVFNDVYVYELDPKTAIEAKLRSNQQKEKMLDVSRELTQYYKAAYNKGSFLSSLKPRFSDMPAMADRLSNLGLSENLGAAVFKSWATFDNKRLKELRLQERGEKLPDPANLVIGQVAAFEAQLGAIEEFSETYGQETLKQVMNTFGIYNFSRYKKEELYEQMKNWTNGEKIDTVIVNARSDWNSYSDNKAIQLDESTSKGMYVFEANNARETARVAVITGQHERTFGREPDVGIFIVYGHGNPNAITMGVNGESINTAAYQVAANNRESKGLRNSEINDYVRHLGENFSIVLYSCSTAGEAEGVAKNLANTVSESHDAPVTAAAEVVYGLMINSAGKVEFKNELGRGTAGTNYSPN